MEKMASVVGITFVDESKNFDFEKSGKVTLNQQKTEMRALRRKMLNEKARVLKARALRA